MPNHLFPLEALMRTCIFFITQGQSALDIPNVCMTLIQSLKVISQLYKLHLFGTGKLKKAGQK